MATLWSEWSEHIKEAGTNWPLGRVFLAATNWPTFAACTNHAETPWDVAWEEEKADNRDTAAIGGLYAFLYKTTFLPITLYRYKYKLNDDQPPAIVFTNELGRIVLYAADRNLRLILDEIDISRVLQNSMTNLNMSPLEKTNGFKIEGNSRKGSKLLEKECASLPKQFNFSETEWRKILNSALADEEKKLLDSPIPEYDFWRACIAVFRLIGKLKFELEREKCESKESRDNCRRLIEKTYEYLARIEEQGGKELQLDYLPKKLREAFPIIEHILGILQKEEHAWEIMDNCVSFLETKSKEENGKTKWSNSPEKSQNKTKTYKEGYDEFMRDLLSITKESPL
jgi:hypothetical protein